MKAILITFDQAHYEDLLDILDHNNVRGFTYWPEVHGRGTKNGDPHYGSHSWPGLNSALITMVEDRQVENLLNILHKLDAQTPALGLRAFVWSIEQAI